MKQLTFMLFAFMSLATFAADYQHPSQAVIDKNRACFQELEVQGCRKMEEDHQQFRECLSNVHDKLSDHCRKMMLDLYGDK